MVHFNSASFAIDVHHTHNRDHQALYKATWDEGIKTVKSDEITIERQDRAAELLLKPRSRFSNVPAFRNLLKRICRAEVGSRLGTCVDIDDMLNKIKNA